MLDINERLKQQNNGEVWIDCNLRPRPRAHHWVFERSGQAGDWYRCNRCPVATVMPNGKNHSHGGSTGSPVPPKPFLR